MMRCLALLAVTMLSWVMHSNCKYISVADTPEVQYLKSLEPLAPESPAVQFWRPQKVGSSTLLSILVSFGFRYNALPRRKGSMNSFCRVMSKCIADEEAYNLTTSDRKQIMKATSAETDGVVRHAKRRMEDIIALRIPFDISLTHEVCAAKAELAAMGLACAFQRDLADIKELFMVREPMARVASVYYFWGELFKMRVRVGGRMVTQGNFPGRAAGETRTSGAANEHRRLQLLNHTELSHQVDISRKLHGGNPADLPRTKTLGSSSNNNMEVRGSFWYHGDETTPPPEDIALAFARRLPYKAGMPGPSFTWSLFASSAEEAIQVMRGEGAHGVGRGQRQGQAQGLRSRIMALVTERLDESLMVTKHFMNTQYKHDGKEKEAPFGVESTTLKFTGWSPADFVYVTKRKSLSHHPRITEWPPSAVRIINETMESKGEWKVYDTANEILDARVRELRSQGINIHLEVSEFQSLRERVAALCLQPEYLQRYQKYLEQSGLEQHTSHNKLRDVDSSFSEDGHEFSLNKEIIYSFDVCGSCEAHGILLAKNRGLISTGAGATGGPPTVGNAQLLKDLPEELTRDNVHFAKCPVEKKV